MMVGGMTQPSIGVAHRGSRWRRAVPHLVGVSWLVLCGIAFLVPALRHGSHIGTYDILSQMGLSKQVGIVPHNPGNGLDQIDSMIPWSNLVWTQVHHGQLPLWNPYNGLGLPLAFNWQSAPLGLPALVGYLVPLQYAFDVGLLVTLVVAGTGMYVLARVLRLNVLACVFAGTVFELSGPLTGWLGYPHAGVMSFGGWLIAAAVLVIRPGHRIGAITFFAIVLALTVYSGQPEVLTVFGLVLVVFVVVLIGKRTPLARGEGPILRPIVDLLVASVAGLALSAPLALPGFQSVYQSTRSGAEAVKPLELHNLMYFIAQGFDGLPIAGSHAFGVSLFYDETAAYVGIVAVVLAALAVSIRFHRPEVIAFSVVTVAMLAVVYCPPVNSLVSSLPVLGKVNWVRALMGVALGVAILSGIGFDALVRLHTERNVRRWAAVWFGIAAVTLLIIFLAGRGTLSPIKANIRATSFVGPAIGIAVGLIVVSMLVIVDRRSQAHRPISSVKLGHAAGIALLLCETGFLLSAGTPIPTSSTTYFKPTPAEVALQKSVGSATVGFGNGFCNQLGIDPSVNVVYGVHELDAYDPIIPASYYSAWFVNTGTPAFSAFFNEFCPLIATTSEARLYGVSYVLEKAGSAGPRGAVFVKKVGDEALYHISRSGLATLTPLTPSGALPPIKAVGTPVHASRPDPARLEIKTSGNDPQVLRLRITDVPGWHATIDGKPLQLESYAGVMLQARVPAGDHTVVVRYWPSSLTVGIVLAIVSAVGLITAGIVDKVRRRRKSIDSPTSSVE